MTKKIRDVMHTSVKSCPPTASISTLAKTMRDADIGALPILDKGQIVGMVTDRDITVRALTDAKHISSLTARDIMTKDVACCRDTDTPAHAEQIMETRCVRRVPVIDSDRKLVGIVSLGDISHGASAELSAKLVKAVSAHHA